MSFLQKLMFFVLIFFITTITYKGIDWGFLNNKGTLNLAICKNKVEAGVCKIPDKTLARGTYQVLPKLLQVVLSLWWENTDKPREKKVDTLVNCTIVDRKNWSCITKEGDIKMELVDGHYQATSALLGKENVGAKDLEKVYSLSRLEYYKLASKPCGNQFIGCLLIDIIFDQYD